MNDTTILAEAIIARLTERGGWVAVDGMTDLAPVTEQPVYAYRHELDDADSGETPGDVTGLASDQPVRTEQRPDRDLLVTTLLALRDAGRIVQGDRHGMPPYCWRLADGQA